MENESITQAKKPTYQAIFFKGHKMKFNLKRTLKLLKPGSHKHLNYIHIGKCGGTTVGLALKESKFIREKFSYVYTTHVYHPVYKPHTRYLFVVRNPISRALSAFNWRYKLVIQDGKKSSIPCEYGTLMKYKSLENLATALYDNGVLNKEVAKEFKTVGHLLQGISYYLKNLDKISSEQVLAVLCQESLGDDIETYLGVTNTRHARKNTEFIADSKSDLSSTARANLAQFLSDDYDCLEKLNGLFPIHGPKFSTLMRK